MTTRHWQSRIVTEKTSATQRWRNTLMKWSAARNTRNAFALVPSNASTASGGDPSRDVLGSHSFEQNPPQAINDGSSPARRLGRCPRLRARGRGSSEAAGSIE